MSRLKNTNICDQLIVLSQINEALSKWQNIISGQFPIAEGIRMCSLCRYFTDDSNIRICKDCPLGLIERACLNKESEWKLYYHKAMLYSPPPVIRKRYGVNPFKVEPMKYLDEMFLTGDSEAERAIKFDLIPAAKQMLCSLIAAREHYLSLPFNPQDGEFVEVLHNNEFSLYRADFILDYMLNLPRTVGEAYHVYELIFEN